MFGTLEETSTRTGCYETRCRLSQSRSCAVRALQLQGNGRRVVLGNGHRSICRYCKMSRETPGGMLRWIFPLSSQGRDQKCGSYHLGTGQELRILGLLRPTRFPRLKHDC